MHRHQAHGLRAGTCLLGGYRERDHIVAVVVEEGRGDGEGALRSRVTNVDARVPAVDEQRHLGVVRPGGEA